MCPLPEKAITLDVAQVRNVTGEMVQVKLPQVNRERCIGCGICEYKCPLHDQPAVICTRLGETRADELLPF